MEGDGIARVGNVDDEAELEREKLGWNDKTNYGSIYWGRFRRI